MACSTPIAHVVVADRALRHRLGLDGLLDAHRPLHHEHPLGHGVGEARPRGDLGRQLARFAQERVGLDEAVVEAPGRALLGRHGAAREQQLARAPLANQPRQDGAGAHVAAREADAVEQGRHLGARRGKADVGGHGDDRARAGRDAVYRRDDGLAAGAHRLHQLARHRGEPHRPPGVAVEQRADDLVHVAAGAETAARAGAARPCARG